ncbi:unnamed protein product [Calypogeia fissa]
MKGLLAGTNKFPGIVVMRKRRRGGVHVVPRKKSRKSREFDEQSLAREGKVRIDPNDQVQVGTGISAQLATGSEGEFPVRQEMETPIFYDGDKATVTLQLKQMVALDGWAMVRLVSGRAAVHGYSLSPGVEVLLCSNSKLAAVVAIGSASSVPMEYLVQPGGRDDDPSLSQSTEMSEMLDQPYTFGCTLEFQSYRGGSVESGPSFDTVKSGEVPSKRTFRIEIGGENGSLVRKDIQKRKRDEEVVGGRSLFESGEADEAEISSSGDEEEEDEDVKMEVDDLLDTDNILLVNGQQSKKPKKEPTPLHATVIPDSWWGAAKSVLYQCAANTLPSQESGKPADKSNLEQNQRAQIVAVIGPKNAGKSTFARFLLNFLLNSHEAVGYLDTDVGQPEFTVPGCLSLHIVREPIFGSPVLHLRNPERSFFYGDVSPKGDPEMYSRSVGALFDYFQRKYGSGKLSTQDDKCRSSVVPLIINTHGWIKGIGYDVLVDILRHTSPTHVVQFTSQLENKNLPAGKFWESSIDSDKTTLLCIESAAEGSDRPLVRVKTASDHLRDLRIMAYFRQCFSRNPLPYPYREDKLFAQTAIGLVCHPPYQVPISAVKIWHLHSQVPTSESLYSINGTLVGLGVGSTALDKDNKSDGFHSSCVGLGIVRGVDTEKGLLYIITPLPSDILQEVDTLLQGRVEIPVSLLQAKGYVSPYLCHNSVAIEGTGSVAMKPQKRFTRIAA